MRVEDESEREDERESENEQQLGTFRGGHMMVLSMRAAAV
jgi:hypothetical protein